MGCSETSIATIYNGRSGADVVSGMGATAIANLFTVSLGGITTSGVVIGKSLGSNQNNQARQEKYGCYLQQ